MNPEFYHSYAFLNAVAAATVALIGILFIIGLHPFKKKKQLLVLAPEEDPLLWVAGDYYTFLRANIMTCDSIEELNGLKAVVESFFDKEFRAPISTADRKRYYARLLEAINTRENDLDSTRMYEMCQN